MKDFSKEFEKSIKNIVDSATKELKSENYDFQKEVRKITANVRKSIDAPDEITLYKLLQVVSRETVIVIIKNSNPIMQGKNSALPFDLLSMYQNSKVLRVEVLDNCNLLIFI